VATIHEGAGNSTTKTGRKPGANGYNGHNELFRHFARKSSNIAGSAGAFLLAVLVIASWAITGPIFGFSDTWQLIINTATTIVTFLMVFLIQNTQNRDSQAIHAKLDELLINTAGARNRLANAENLTDEELVELKKEFQEAAEQAGQTISSRSASPIKD
jgi:low affinity Fe/Cu permease